MKNFNNAADTTELPAAPLRLRKATFCLGRRLAFKDANTEDRYSAAIASSRSFVPCVLNEPFFELTAIRPDLIRTD